MLALFDIDGTLLLDDACVHGRALLAAAREVYGVDPPDDAVQRIGPHGKTDRRILREVLHAEGLGDDAAIDARLSAWQATATEAFARSSTEGWVMRDGLRDGLTRLRDAAVRLGLLTGNLEGIAVAKVRAMQLADLIDVRVGGFGSDSEIRAELVPLARARAGGWPAQATVVVGDTPADAEAARADGAGAILFASGRLAAQPRHGADAVVADVPALVDLLVPWRPDEAG